MVLPSSGTLSYNTIRAEFGSPSSNVYLSLYYRGGPYTYNVPANSNITTSSTGSISVSNFYSARGKTDYASGVFGFYTSGGKIPDQRGGVGGPNLPSMGDTSIRTNVLSTGFTTNYAQQSIAGSTYVMGPFAGGNNNQSRTFRYYGTNGALSRQFTWPANAQTGSGGNTSVGAGSTTSPTTFTVGPSGTVISASAWNIGGTLIIRGF